MQASLWKRVSVIFISGLVLFSPVFAASSATPFNNYFNHSIWHPMLTLTAGAAFNSDAGHSQNFPATDEIFSFFNYAANNTHQTLAIFGGFVGAEFLLHPKWDLQAGLAYYQPSTFHTNGIVTQGIDPDSENLYTYKYAIQSRQLLAESKLLYHCRYFHPYLSAGIGAAWNRSQSFAVNIQPPFTTLSNQFNNNTMTSFTYSVGLGLDVDMTKQARIGIGYRFADLGKSKTGNGIIDDVITQNTLSQSHLYTHEILAQLTFILM